MNDLRFSVLGFRCYVTPGFLVLLGVYGLFGLERGDPVWATLSWCAVVFVSILIHELGHAVVSRRLGLRVIDIRFWQFGGYVTHQPGTPFQNLAVSLAGPGIELVFGMICWGIYLAIPPVAYVDTVLNQLIYVNIYWALFNLLPMQPMDGGNSLNYLLRGLRVGDTERIVSGVGMVTALGLALFAWQSGMTIIAVFCLYFLIHNFQRFQASQRGAW